MDNKLNSNPLEPNANFQQIKGVVKGCRVYYEHSISGGGGGGGGVGGYVNIKPIDHDATKHNEFWIVDSAGKEHFFDIDVPVTDGQLMSVFVSNHPIKQIFAVYNHSSVNRPGFTRHSSAG